MNSDTTEMVPTENIQYDFFVSPFGRGIIAASASGICDIAFAEASDDELVGDLERHNPDQQLTHVPGRFAEVCRDLFSSHSGDCQLDMRGSEFQVAVWSALRQIPMGQTVSYQQLAQRLGQPRAARAVGNAVAKNRLAFLVPCHRVIHADGSVGAYRRVIPWLDTVQELNQVRLHNHIL